MITPEDIIQLMDSKASNVCERTFLGERANATTSSLKEFVVCSLPYSSVDRMLGENDDWWVDMTVVFEIYVADRKTAHNPKEMDVPRLKELRKAILGEFPIVSYRLGVKIVRPRTVINAASDGNGYHYTRIQAKLTTMV